MDYVIINHLKMLQKSHSSKGGDHDKLIDTIKKYSENTSWKILYKDLLNYLVTMKGCNCYATFSYVVCIDDFFLT